MAAIKPIVAVLVFFIADIKGWPNDWDEKHGFECPRGTTNCGEWQTGKGVSANEEQRKNVLAYLYRLFFARFSFIITSKLCVTSETLVGSTYLYIPKKFIALRQNLHCSFEDFY